MLSVAESIADAGIADEVCPLCLVRYAQVDECTCVVCNSYSCPGCAELLDTSGRMRCYACAPVYVPEPRHVDHGALFLVERAARAVERSLSQWYRAGAARWKRTRAAAAVRERASSLGRSGQPV